MTGWDDVAASVWREDERSGLAGAGWTGRAIGLGRRYTTGSRKEAGGRARTPEAKTRDAAAEAADGTGGRGRHCLQISARQRGRSSQEHTMPGQRQK